MKTKRKPIPPPPNLRPAIERRTFDPMDDVRGEIYDKNKGIIALNRLQGVAGDAYWDDLPGIIGNSYLGISQDNERREGQCYELWHSNEPEIDKRAEVEDWYLRLGTINSMNGLGQDLIDARRFIYDFTTGSQDPSDRISTLSDQLLVMQMDKDSMRDGLYLADDADTRGIFERDTNKRIHDFSARVIDRYRNNTELNNEEMEVFHTALKLKFDSEFTELGLMSETDWTDEAGRARVGYIEGETYRNDYQKFLDVCHENDLHTDLDDIEKYKLFRYLDILGVQCQLIENNSNKLKNGDLMEHYANLIIWSDILAGPSRAESDPGDVSVHYTTIRQDRPNDGIIRGLNRLSIDSELCYKGGNIPNRYIQVKSRDSDEAVDNYYCGIDILNILKPEDVDKSKEDNNAMANREIKSGLAGLTDFLTETLRGEFSEALSNFDMFEGHLKQVRKQLFSTS